jgi:hypothetical protein
MIVAATLWSVRTASGAIVTLFKNNITKTRWIVHEAKGKPIQMLSVESDERIPEPTKGSHIATSSYKSTTVVEVLSN